MYEQPPPYPGVMGVGYMAPNGTAYASAPAYAQPPMQNPQNMQYPQQTAYPQQNAQYSQPPVGQMAQVGS